MSIFLQAHRYSLYTEVFFSKKFSLENDISGCKLDIKMSNETPPASRTSRRIRGQAPAEVAARAGSPTSAISGLTESTSVQNNRSRIEDRMHLTLAQLANIASPLAIDRSNPALTAAEEENAYDNVAYSENPGASDSEDDNEIDPRKIQLDDDDDADLDRVALEALFAAEDNAAAMIPEDDPVAEVKLESTAEEPWCYGAPSGWLPTQIPDGWEPKKRDGAPDSFDSIDNPGGWSKFSYQARFKKEKGGDYLYHALPTGATPVPANATGKRTCKGWEFHYKGWEKEDDDRVFRDGAVREDMFPGTRKGSLDRSVLRKLGMSQERLLEPDENGEMGPDALFFYQLLLPIHRINDSDNDPRDAFYAKASKWSNVYGLNELDIGSGFGHKYENTTADELLRWDGVVVMDGVRGGSSGAILRRFDKRKSNTAYDPFIDEAFTKTRFLELKRVWKICDNRDPANARGHPDYNPCYKYDYLFKTIVHNVNAITLFAGLDLVGDESSYAHRGYGEPGAGNVMMVRGKPQVTKGMQTVIVSDVDRMRPRAYLHRHKLNKKHEGFSYPGQNEVRQLWDEGIAPLLLPGNQLVGKALFSRKPHLTFDNYFSGDSIMKYAAEEGFGFTCTVSRDRLPAGVPAKYWCKQKTGPTVRSKHARYENPIFAVQHLGQSIMTITSFQSTSSCNIASVNALNRCTRYCATKERGRKQHKRRWGIEMNEARQLYLKTYGVVDKIDHLIQNCNLKYR